MLPKVCSAAVNGIDAYPVEVEVNAGCGDRLLCGRGTGADQPRLPSAFIIQLPTSHQPERNEKNEQPSY